MPKLLDLLKFIDRTWPRSPALAPVPVRQPDRRPLFDERYPLDGADIESVSEYRLASLMQYPHY